MVALAVCPAAPIVSTTSCRKPAGCSRGLRLWAEVAVFAAVCAVGSVFAAERPLEDIAAIRAVQSWSELSSYPLAVAGVVTLVDPARNLVVLQDHTGSLAFELGSTRPDVAPGQRVSLTASNALPFLPDLPRYPSRPDRTERLGSFESVPESQKGFFVARFRGYVLPPVTGEYRFAIASDDASRLMLGTSEDPASRRLIARVLSYTRPRDWQRTAPQVSDQVHLEAGHAYYIEAVHQQAEGPAHLSVAWEGPGIPLDLIPGEYLAPWSVDATTARHEGGPSISSVARGSVFREVWEDVTVDTPDVLVTPRQLGGILSVQDAEIRVLGQGRLPNPVRMHAGQPMTEGQDFQWSELEATVDFAGSDGKRQTLELADQDGRVEAIVPGAGQPTPSTLRGRRVRVVGVAESVVNDSGSRVLGRIWLQPSGPLTVTAAAPATDLARLVSISELVNGPQDLLRDAAVKIVGKVVDLQDDRVTISDSGTFHASVSDDGTLWRPLGPPVAVAMASRVYAGLAVNSGEAKLSSDATFDEVKGLSRTAPCVDIGKPSPAGHLAMKGGRYEVSGSGSDIWNSPDQFTYVCEPLEGNGTVMAHLASFRPATGNARAGVMIREGLSPDAQYVYVTLTSGIVPATRLQWRKAAVGGAMGSIADTTTTGEPASWMKLERRFNTVVAFANAQVPLAVGDTVDAVGYVKERSGRPALVNASLARHLDEPPPPTTDEKWRPLVEIARVSDGTRSWGGFDFFRIRGVVTFCGDVLGRHYWAVQDRSAAVLLAGREPSSLFQIPAGTLVEVCSSPGWFPPTSNFYVDNVFNLGAAAFPVPVRHPAEYLLPRRGEGTWIELEGIVRSVADNGVMEIRTRGEIVAAAVQGARTATLREAVDADVRVRGVIVYPSERERLLLVPSAEKFEIAGAPPRGRFPSAAESMQTLTAKTLLNQSRHRTCITGVITYVDRSRAYLQDEFGGARIELDGSTSMRPGTTVDVAGFPDWAEEEGVVLRHAVLRALPRASRPVQPVVVSPRDAGNGRSTFQLVRVRAVVSRMFGTLEGETLELDADQRVFRVTLPAMTSALGTLPPGTLVELTGVNVSPAGLWRRTGPATEKSSLVPIDLLLRSPADIVVLQKPSWWAVKRTLLVLTLVGLAALVAVVWIHQLRQRVKQRTAELATAMAKLERETRMSATLAERDRVAGEIHDSLEQGLNGLLLHLESMAGSEACPPAIRSGLDLARNMASFSRTEVQNAVWELQSPMLEDSELPSAVQKVVRQITPESLEATVHLEGSPRRLPSMIEHHLLRIAQEAVNNTVKHAGARHVDVALRYDPEAVQLSVADDGCGFVPGQVRTGGLGHFGLRSLRSRAAKIGAEVEIVSSPGRGTRIQVRVPVFEKPL